ncbi:thioesterase domain-containing protein [Luteibacter sp. 9135]|uniref:thioesterase domain-containing protein n=1 Tax=Luteibacter sp. 9135 TaxID=1500893 RepID=UPI00056603F5|nr:thioesterase domain-containing protein [Luteibacter sp. 9135]
MDLPETHCSTVVELNQSSARRVVFCVHPAGGGVGYYEGLARALEQHAKLYALEEPFIYGDFSYGSLPELAEYHVDVIRSIQPDGPYTIFGYCSGGVIAYEVACQLQLAGAEVDSVSLFGSGRVSGFDPEERERVTFLRDYIAARYGIELGGLDWERMETFSFREVADVIVDSLRRQGIPEAGSDLEWAARCIESMCLMRQATRKYRAPRSKLDVFLYEWHYLDPVIAEQIKPWCDWNTLTEGKLTVVAPPEREGPGVDIMYPPYLEQTVDRVKQITLGLGRLRDVRCRTDVFRGDVIEANRPRAGSTRSRIG